MSLTWENNSKNKQKGRKEPANHMDHFAIITLDKGIFVIRSGFLNDKSTIKEKLSYR